MRGAGAPAVRDIDFTEEIGMIFLTGTGGNVGPHLVAELQARGVPFRASYRSGAKRVAAAQAGIDAVSLDLGDRAAARAAFEGVGRLFLLMGENERQSEIELETVRAARAAGVRHVVKLSGWDPDRLDYGFGRTHRPAERALEASSMDWTFLRCNGFMQNAVNYFSPTIRDHGAFYATAAEARVAHLDARDIAAVAAAALTEQGHAGRAYRLSGPRGADVPRPGEAHRGGDGPVRTLCRPSARGVPAGRDRRWRAALAGRSLGRPARHVYPWRGCRSHR